MTKLTKLNLTKYEKMYDSFDVGHNRNHFINVRKMAVKLAKKYAPDKVELAYIAATLHDIGISIGREEHESNGEKLIRQDEYLKTNLPKDDFEELCHAIKEHRASTGNPQSILAKIVSDADRSSSSSGSKALSRAYNYGLEKFPDLIDDENIMRAAKHQAEKFCKGSYGRRTYFPETEKKLAKIYDPMVTAYQKGDLNYFKRLLQSLIK